MYIIWCAYIYVYICFGDICVMSPASILIVYLYPAGHLYANSKMYDLLRISEQPCCCL